LWYVSDVKGMTQHTPINVAVQVELSDAVPVLFRNGESMCHNIPLETKEK